MSISISEGWLRCLVIAAHDLRSNVEIMESVCVSMSDPVYDKVRHAKLKLIEVERLLDDARLLSR